MKRTQTHNVYAADGNILTPTTTTKVAVYAITIPRIQLYGAFQKIKIDYTKLQQL